MTCGCTDSGFTIVEGDTLPVLTATLRDADGALVDLTDATVEFVGSHTTYGYALTKEAEVVGDPEDGAVSLAFEAGELYAGTYAYRWRVTVDDAVRSYPAAGETLTVEPDVGGGGCL